MYSDRLTLALAYHYIYNSGNSIIVNGKIESANVIDITFSYLNKYTDPNNRRTIKFDTIDSLATRIDEIGTSTIIKAECDGNMGVYELKSFSISTNNGSFAYVKNSSNGWTCNNDMVPIDQINSLNIEYQPTYDKTEELYLGIEYVEYIQDQTNYIDCGYIRRWFGLIVDELIRLYSTYNNTYNKDKNTL